MKTALLLLTTLLAPQEPQDASTSSNLYLRLTDGDVVSGQLLALDGDAVKLRIAVLGGYMTVTRTLADFEPASAFRVQMAANPPKDFAGHLAMAAKAAELGVRVQAGAEARAAIEAAGDDQAKVDQVRAWGADALEKMVRAAVAAGDLKEAQHCLKLLTTRLADQRSEAQLDTIAAVVEGLEQKTKDAKAAARQARLDEQQRDAIERRLKPIEQHVAKGKKAYQDAIRKSASTVASTNLCEKAIEHFKAGYQALQELVARNPDDAALAQVAADLGKDMHDDGIAAALHAANMLCVQSDYKGAMDWAQRVIAFEPDNAEAKAMVHTITIAAAAASGDWGWGWRVVGDRPDPRRNR